jgi:hypothetical protein
MRSIVTNAHRPTVAANAATAIAASTGSWASHSNPPQGVVKILPRGVLGTHGRA